MRIAHLVTLVGMNLREKVRCGNRKTRAAPALLCLAAFLLVSGCAFRTLKKDIERAGVLATIEGRAAVRDANAGPIVVVVYSSSEERVADLYILSRPESFYFTLPTGTYRLAAFEDLNRDLAYQPEQEPAAVFGDPTGIVLQAGEHRTDVDLMIDPAAGERIPFAVTALAPGHREIAQLPDFHLGTVVELDDPRFSSENGQLGLWNPLRFLFDVGAGVYFLEEYDPQKIPVLFVHGATGHPAEWEFLIRKMDRTRFQPWLVYYASATRLERTAQGLLRALAALQVRYGFTQLIVVAHSMGGLVVRAAINRARADPTVPRQVDLAALVTISTPWSGFAAAAAAVEHAPVVAPSWEDMASGSPFLTALPQTPLPSECEYSLLFGYRGGSGIGREANDGTVTVSSELPLSIQRQAARVLGFNEDHTSILGSPEVAAELNAILNRNYRRLNQDYVSETKEAPNEATECRL